MIVVLYGMAGVFAAMMLATVAFSNNWLASGIRGTVRQGVLGAVFLVPFALYFAVVGAAVFAIVTTILYFLDLVE
jgi:sensor domain CHASE-containing protein